jgi:uncharacterized membrane protein
MKKVLFPNITFWLLLFIPVTFIGFYPSYFSKIISGVPSIYHIHAFFMIVWLALAITQPYLIYKKKTKQHQLLGKISYILMPLVIISSWLMMRHSYFNYIHTALEKLPAGSIATEEMKIAAANNLKIGILYGGSLALFYLLAVYYRKNMTWHASFMLAATLTLTGPTVDRAIYPLLVNYKLPFNDFIISFLIIDLILLALIVYQRKKGTNFYASLFALLFYISWQVLFYILPEIKIWKWIVNP